MTPYFTDGHKFYFHSPYQYHSSPYQPRAYRQYPTVDPGTFMTSAKSMEKIMKDANLLLARMGASRPFAFELMSAAQASKQEKVRAMIKSTGITHIPKVRYTPDGLNLQFEFDDPIQNCCSLTLSLRWK